MSRWLKTIMHFIILLKQSRLIKNADIPNFSIFHTKRTKINHGFSIHSIHFDEKALEFFRTVYPELTSGGIFNPLIDNEVISVYQSVNRILREKYGYAGIYVIFDEFSKYIEGHTVDGFADDMKVLQDIRSIIKHHA